MGHELCDEYGVYVSWGIGVQRGHLRVEHEFSDGYGWYVYVSVGVQRGHLRVGHELGDGYAWYVSCVGVVGFMYSFRWGHVY